MSYRCRICGGTWTEIPDDAVEIDLAKSRGTRRGKLYKFAGGVVHELRKLPQPSLPVVEQPLAQEVQPEKLPEPEIVEEAEQAESQLSSIASLSAAFSRIRSKKDSR